MFKYTMKKLFAILLLSLCNVANAQPNQGAWGLYDYELNEYQMTLNRSEIRSIASVTKLFTATTIVRAGLDLDERVKVQGKAKGRFSRGMMVSRNDLMKAMLISSDNLAAETLAHTYPGGFDAFITDTNTWVRGWGLIDTAIVDASGLLAANQSTVDNLVSFLYKIRHYDVIRTISAEEQAILKLPKGKKNIKINLRNTNSVLFHFDNILISKTGTTSAAGKCVVMLVEKNKTYHAVVVLGQRDSKARHKIAESFVAMMPLSKVEAAIPLVLDIELPL
jgi:D-alanyl-D-alanine endopeptidase (penicillin-binding protein 7)